MKRLKQISYILVLGLFGIAGCQQNDQVNSSPDSTASSVHEENTPLGQASVVDEESDANILQVAIGSPDHTTLVAAVQAANIEHVLVNAGPLTVFAPTNDAFAALPEGTVESLVQPENKGKLSYILQGHAAPGSYDLEGLKKNAAKNRKLYMANGAYLTITVEGEDVFVEGAKVLATIQTSNGIINVVDKVIITE